jgi:outer membrane receptor for ferrienterochelin and colicin
MKLLKFLIVLIVCMPGFGMLHAQEISGTVFGIESDAGNEQKIPLPGVNIYWSGTTEGTVSDENGNFSLPSNSNTKVLIASFIGYQNDTLSIDQFDKSIQIVFTTTNELNEVTIAEKQHTSFVSKINPLHVHNVTGEELQKAACCNLAESFETNASVDVSYSDAVSGAKKIELLGLHGKYIQMMTENLPNLRGLSSTYGLGYIPGSWMESIQISKGTSSVLNGYESLTGQINIEYKKPDGDEKLYLNTYVNSIGKIEGNFNGAYKLNDKWSTMLFLHAENLNNKIDDNEDSFIDAPLIKQYNIYNRWKYRNKNHIAQFGVKVLEEDRTGGQTEFNKNEVTDIPSFYGVNVKTKRYEFWGKTGYIFANRPGTSIGFVNSFTYHNQESFFGLNQYDGRENNYYANLIFQSNIISENHKYNTGLSYMYDEYKEALNDSSFSRKESVPGVFFEYTYSDLHRFIVLLGIRADFHNIWGTFYTPRVHAKYDINEHSIIRVSAGKGYRTANFIAENSYLLASSRTLHIANNIRQEEAWNYGLNFTQIFKVNQRELNLNIEFYRTDFINQVIIDRDQSVSEIHIYNLDGQSYSNSIQIEAVYEVIPNLDMVAAFRYSDVKMSINNSFEREPLVNRYKGLLNLSYKTPLEKWQFDFTTQLNGDARLPNTSNNPVQYQRPENSKVYTIMNAQITKYFRKWNVYIGVENLGNFTQNDPIIAADDPFGPYFDSSIIWGPIMGRKFYAGLKFQIK